MLYNSVHTTRRITILLSMAFFHVTKAGDFQNTGFCTQKADGLHRNPMNCQSFFICHSGGSQRLMCVGNLVFNENSGKCDFGVCHQDPRDSLLSDSFIGNPNFCVAKADGLHIDPRQCDKFYSCVKEFTFSFSCPPGLYYNQHKNACDWPRNVPCPQTTGLVTTSRPTVNPWTPQTWTPQTWTPQPWTPQPWTPQPWTPQPWTSQPWTPQPWSPTPTMNQRQTTMMPPLPNTYSPITPAHFGGCKRVVCYFTNWAQYRNGQGKQFPSDLDARLCTHIIYAFAKLQGNTLIPYEWNDDSTEWSVGNYERAIKLKETNPALKVLLAVGGWNMGSLTFSAMVSSPQNRKEFVETTITFLRKRGFDGIDLDWEYPANRGSLTVDRDRHSMLLSEMRSAFEQEAVQTGNERLLLTAAVAAGKSKIDSAYRVPVLNRMLDFINLMTYDLHGGWESKTGHNSPLYADRSETGDDVYLNVDWATRYWIQKGASPSKLVLGLPFYARTFKLSSANSGIGAPVSGKGPAGSHTREAGVLSYYEVCQKIKNGARLSKIRDQRVPYLVDNGQWIGFDDRESIQEKVRYAKKMNLGGVMVWDLSQDDFKGTFCDQGPWPLMNAILNQCRAS